MERAERMGFAENGISHYAIRVVCDDESVDPNTSTITDFEQRLRMQTSTPDRGTIGVDEVPVFEPPFHLEGDDSFSASTPPLSSRSPRERAPRPDIFRFDPIIDSDEPPGDRDIRPPRSFARSVPESLGRTPGRSPYNSTSSANRFGYEPNLSLGSLVTKSLSIETQVRALRGEVRALNVSMITHHVEAEQRSNYIGARVDGLQTVLEIQHALTGELLFQMDDKISNLPTEVDLGQLHRSISTDTALQIESAVEKQNAVCQSLDYRISEVSDEAQAVMLATTVTRYTNGTATAR